MRRWATFIPPLVLLVCLGTTAAPAGAAPLWKFNGSELTKAESIAGDTGESSFAAPGLVTACEGLSYGMTVANEGGSARGSLNEMSFEGCSTNLSECLIESIAAEALPWQVRGKVVKSIDYVFLEGVKVTVEYAPNGNCLLDGIALTFTGTAGGSYDNATGSFAFDSASFTATGASISALGTPFQWSGVFTTEALGPHSGQVLELK